MRSKILKFKRNKNIKKLYANQFTITLGQEYFVYVNGKYNPMRCVFIKTSPKGFNLLNLNTHRCIFKRQIYDSVFSWIDIPYSITTFTFWIPNWVYSIEEIKTAEMA